MTTTTTMKSKPSLEDALRYTHRVKEVFGESSPVYQEFLDTMAAVRRRSHPPRKDAHGVARSVSRLFRGHPDLLEGFNAFLPEDCRIDAAMEETGMGAVDPPPSRDPSAGGSTSEARSKGAKSRWPRFLRSSRKPASLPPVVVGTNPKPPPLHLVTGEDATTVMVGSMKQPAVVGNSMSRKQEVIVIDDDDDEVEILEPPGGVDKDLALARRLARNEQEERDMALALSLATETWETHEAARPKTREEVLGSLEACQRAAMDRVRSQAKTLHEKALPRLEKRVQGFDDCSKEDLVECLRYIRDEAPIIIHFKEATLSLLVKDTHYRNQFETNTSGGSLNHSARRKWETKMFGSSYRGVDDSLRVKYGCLNLSGDIAGVPHARHYGPVFVMLRPEVRHRTTFFYRDTGNHFSSSGTKLATNDCYAHVLDGYDDAELKAVLEVCRSARIGGARSHGTEYREVQIHGPVCLATDIQALSVPGHQQSASKTLLDDVEAFRRKTNCNILWQGDLLHPNDE